MEAKDFLKSKKIWLGTKVADMNVPENYCTLEDLLEEYHRVKSAIVDELPLLYPEHDPCNPL